MSRLGSGCARGSAAAVFHVCVCAPASAPALSIINGHAADVLKRQVRNMGTDLAVSRRDIQSLAKYRGSLEGYSEIYVCYSVRLSS